MSSNCQSCVSSSQVFTETLYKYSNINFQLAAFLSIFVFYRKPYFVFVYILKIDSQFVFTIYSTYNVFEFVSTSNTNCLLGFPSNSVQGSIPNIFHESKTQTFIGTVKVQFFDCNSVTSWPEVALPEAELGRNENWKKQCEISHFFMISWMIPKFWTNIKSLSQWREKKKITLTALSTNTIH